MANTLPSHPDTLSTPGAGSTALIELSGITRSFGMGELAVEVLHGIDLKIYPGEFVAIVGSSGSGKSTLMNILGCLDKPTSGHYLFMGEDVASFDRDELARLRREAFGFVFQSYNLVGTATARENVEIPAVYAGMPPDERQQRAETLLASLGLEARCDHRPSQLSGGQQQRVAIARTLAPEPSVLFMDEPLSNLDAKLRLEMRYELQRLHLETGSTFVYVTHDQMEAMTLATRICLINNGVLQQYDPPLKVYNSPDNLFVADFVGNPSINFINAHGDQEGENIRLTMLGGAEARFIPNEKLDLAAWYVKRDADAEVAAAANAERAKAKGYVEKSNKDEAFRPHIAKVEENDDALTEEPEIADGDFVLGVRPEFIAMSGESGIDGEIYGVMPTGMECTLKIRVGEFLLTSVAFGSSLFAIGTKSKFRFTGSNIMLFDRKSGRRIVSGRLEIK